MANVIPERYRKWQKKEDNTVQVKTGGGFDDCLTLNCKPLAAGRYRIAFQGEGRTVSGTGRQCKFRIQVDGQTRMLRLLSNETEWDGRAGWDFYKYADGDTPVIVIQVQRFGNGPGNVEIQKLKLSIELMEE